MTVMGDALRDRLSDRGSIPLRSTKKDDAFICIVFFYHRINLIQTYKLFLFDTLLQPYKQDLGNYHD